MTSIFYWHPVNDLAKKLRDQNGGAKGFHYQTRAELDFKLQRLLIDAKYDVWPTFHTTLGPLGGPGDLVSRIELDPDDPFDQHTAKLCNKQHINWTFIKIHNGPNRGVIGYCTSSANSPYAMGSAEMAQKGIINATYVPRPV